MKFRYILLLSILAIAGTLAVTQTSLAPLGSGSGTISQLNLFRLVDGYIKSISDTAGLQITSLGSANNCLITDANGKFSAVPCSEGSMTALPHTQIYVGNASNSATATSSVTVADSGYVGIGTTSPTYQLDVHGNSRVYGSLIVTGGITGTASGNDILGQATSTLTSHTTTYNHTNYDTAYGWGDHSLLGYLNTAGVNAYIHASTTIPKTYTANTFTGLQTIGNASTTFTSATRFFGDLTGTASGNLVSGGTLTNNYHCRWDGTGIDCDRVEDASGACGANAVCMGGHTHVGVNETYGSGWDGDTSTPEKDDIYDWGHLFDTDDDGKVNVLDTGYGVVLSGTTGIVSVVQDLSVNTVTATSTTATSSFPILDVVTRVFNSVSSFIVEDILGIKGTNGTLSISSETDGGDYNIYSSNGAQTLAIYGSAGNTLGLNLLDGLLTAGAGFTMSAGTADFSAGTLILPTGTNPTVDANGEIAHDTSGDQLIVGANADVVPLSDVKIWSVTVASTSQAFIEAGLLPIPTVLDGFTITRIQCHVSGGTSKVIAVEDASANSSEDVTCATTNTTDDGSITNATYTASELSFLDFGATSGAVNYVTVSVFGNWTRE